MINEISNASPSSWWRKYRIVDDGFLGYEAQIKYIWGVWRELNFSNTHETIEDAKDYCLKHSNKGKALYI